jgi:hypothetical protein
MGASFGSASVVGSNGARSHERIQNDKEALVVLIIARAFYLGLQLRLVALLFACALRPKP